MSRAPLSARETELLNAALAYAERGFRVMPCAGKVPRLPRGLNDASAERDLVTAWWGGLHRGANIGLVVPEWAFVLDVDTAEGHADGADGLAALDRLEAEYGELPDTPRATTGRGGLHAFFRLPAGVVRGNDDKGLPAGLNVRAGGKGYIIAPPSMHPDTGRLYQWQTFRALEHVELAELPPWLVRLTEPRHHPAASGDRPPLPTTLPPRVRDVLAAADLRGKVRPGPKGEGEVYVLSRCPACNDAHGPGRCYVTASGRLKTHHAESCPASAKRTDGRGLSLREWVAAYVPAALPALEPATVGDIPGAVEAVRRDEPIYFCDALDHPAAAAWSRAPENPEGGAALGVRSADELQAVAVRLFAALESAELAGKARVLCIPRKGAEPAMAAAADRLAGIGAVHLVHLAVAEMAEGDAPPRTADDLASVARMGAHYLRVLFHRAELRHAAPLDVHAPDFNAQMAELQRKALRDARRLYGLDALTVFVTPPAAGKTTSMLGIAAETASSRAFWTPDGGRARSRSPRVIVALPDHANAAEKLDAFRKAYPDVTADHARGMLSWCPLAADPEKRPAIERGAAILGRRMCEGCPLAGGCAGALAPRAPRNAVTFGAHAGIAGLVNAIDGGEAGDPPGPDDLVVIDEIPALVNVQTCGAMELRSLRKSYAARGAAWWHTSHTGHGDLAAELGAVADALDAATPRDEHAQRCTAADVLKDLRERPAALDAARRCLAEMEEDAAAAGADSPTPPAPTAEEARAGAVGERWPDAGAWNLVRMFAAALCKAPEDAPELRLMCLRLEAWGAGWAFETRVRFELPTGVRVLALDADGLRRRHEWEALGAAAGRPVHMVTVMVRGDRPAAAEHYRTERLRTRRLWARKGRRVTFLSDAPGAVRNALLRAARDVPCTLGILTHKPLADALRWGVALAEDPAAVPPDGAAFATGDGNAREVANLAAELRRRGWTMKIGHFGRDDRASNDFERVDVLAVLGAPRPDWGAAAEDARALGLDPAELPAVRTVASTIQAIARARHLRRGGVRIFLAADCEAPIGGELPGVAWTVEDTDRSHAPAFEVLDAAAAAAAEVAAWADRAGCIDVHALKAALTPHVMGWRVAERLAREEAERRGWPTRAEGKGGRTVYRPADAPPLIGSNNKGSDGLSVPMSGGALPTSPAGLDPPAGAVAVEPSALPSALADTDYVGDLAAANNWTPPPRRRPTWWAMPPGLADVPLPSEYEGPPLPAACEPPPWEMAG